MHEGITITNKHTSEVLTLNVGPQHPSTHGVLHLVVDFDGEILKRVEPDCGYLHRGVEKMAENRHYQSSLPHISRLDYLSPYTNDWGFSMAVEKMLGWEIPQRAEYIRVILGELSRIASHLVWLATHALDIGAMTIFLYCFREREQILDILDEMSGQRMNSSWICIGGVRKDVTPKFVGMVKEFCRTFPARVKEYELLLNSNRIWLMRTQNVGVLTREEAINYGVSGPMMRASGVDMDMRRDNPYSVYSQFTFKVPVYKEGDTYARYRVRMEEMLESNSIVEQAIANLPQGRTLYAKNAKDDAPETFAEQDSKALSALMAGRGIRLSKGESYTGIEAPKGELGFYIIHEKGASPYRLKVRAPSFINLAALPKLSEGHSFADLMALIGSIDLVLGECDK